MDVENHTSGPWLLTYNADYDATHGEIGHIVQIIIGRKAINITYAGMAGDRGCSDDYEEQIANAKLIAMAPDLYEFVKDVAKQRIPPDDDEPNVYMEAHKEEAQELLQKMENIEGGKA